MQEITVSLVSIKVSLVVLVFMLCCLLILCCFYKGDDFLVCVCAADKAAGVILPPSLKAGCMMKIPFHFPYFVLFLWFL